MVAAAQIFWQHHPSVYHLTVMPCLDKKLEASRADFVDDISADIGAAMTKFRRVDMVITTYELLQLLQDAIVETTTIPSQIKGLVSTIMEEEEEDIVRRALATISETAASAVHVQRICTRDTPVNAMYRDMQQWLQQQSAPSASSGPYLWTTPVPGTATPELPSGAVDIMNSDATAPSRFSALGAGGYADFIFRYAARELFHLDDITSSSPSIWRPVVDSTPTPRISARVARQRKHRECYEAVIVQDTTTGRYRVADAQDGVPDSQAREDRTIVMRFVIASGMSTVQQVLTEYGSSSNGRLDYMEGMACSNNACLNGNGQIRSVERETPIDVRNRVQQTLTCFEKSLQDHSKSIPGMILDQDEKDRNPIIMGASMDRLPLNPSLFTRYHIVPPMQHTMGIASGLAVEDTMW